LCLGRTVINLLPLDTCDTNVKFIEQENNHTVEFVGIHTEFKTDFLDRVTNQVRVSTVVSLFASFMLDLIKSYLNSYHQASIFREFIWMSMSTRMTVQQLTGLYQQIIDIIL